MRAGLPFHVDGPLPISGYIEARASRPRWPFKFPVIADPARVRDPNRKGTVESAIQHTQSTAEITASGFFDSAVR